MPEDAASSSSEARLIPSVDPNRLISSVRRFLPMPGMASSCETTARAFAVLRERSGKIPS